MGPSQVARLVANLHENILLVVAPTLQVMNPHLVGEPILEVVDNPSHHLVAGSTLVVAVLPDTHQEDDVCKDHIPEEDGLYSRQVLAPVAADLRENLEAACDALGSDSDYDQSRVLPWGQNSHNYPSSHCNTNVCLSSLRNPCHAILGI